MRRAQSLADPRAPFPSGKSTGRKPCRCVDEPSSVVFIYNSIYTPLAGMCCGLGGAQLPVGRGWPGTKPWKDSRMQ